MNKHKTKKKTNFLKNSLILINYNQKYHNEIIRSLYNKKHTEFRSWRKKVSKINSNELDNKKKIFEKIHTERNDIKYLKNEMIKYKKNINYLKYIINNKSKKSSKKSNSFRINQGKKLITARVDLSISKNSPESNIINENLASITSNFRKKQTKRTSYIKNLILKQNFKRKNSKKIFTGNLNNNYLNLYKKKFKSHKILDKSALNYKNFQDSNIPLNTKLNSLNSNSNNINNLSIDSIKLKNKTTMEFEELDEKKRIILDSYFEELIY